MTHLAVLISVYNGDHAGQFERALLSILNQRLPDNHDLNIYLGIDGPIPPPLEEVVAKYQSQIHLVSRSIKNIGLACTLNRLILARGDEAYFFRMDSDDISLPDRFSAQLAYLEGRHDIDILGTKSTNAVRTASGGL